MADKDQILQNLAGSIVETMKEQIRLKDHKMTGALIDSVEEIIKVRLTGATIEIWMEYYGLALNNGVPPERIPFTPPSGRGGTSKYIEGLKRFVQLKLGIKDEKKILGAAFAIARKQKEKGLPIAGPSKFIEATLTKEKDKIEQAALEWARAVFESELQIFVTA